MEKCQKTVDVFLNKWEHGDKVRKCCEDIEKVKKFCRILKKRNRKMEVIKCLKC